MKDKSQVLAGLTNYGMTRDPVTRLMVPAIPDDPGVIHALRPSNSRRPILEPHFIEHTEDYRAALCGAQIKVVLPLSFKPEEAGACPECIEDLKDLQPAVVPTFESNPIFEKPGGDDWWSSGGLRNPGYNRRRTEERRRRQEADGRLTQGITFT